MVNITAEKAREMTMIAIENIALTASFMVDNLIENAAKNGENVVFIKRDKLGAIDYSDRSIAIIDSIVTIYEGRGYHVGKGRDSVSISWKNQ